jgi:cyclopropane-fatty-acyl-phospholipid synthase
MTMGLRQRALKFLQSRLADPPLPLRLVFWDGERFDFSDAPKLTIELRSAAVLRKLLRGDFAGLGEAYVAGNLTVNGRIEDILQTGIALADRIGRSRTMARMQIIGRLLPHRHTKRKDASDIRYHYDVSDDFYRLWLDADLTYSCAYFRSGAETIDQAQQQKLDHICRKLMLRRGERLLDIGCGWGSLLRWAAQHYGVSGVGITLSENQFRYARERLAHDSLKDRVEIRLQDYRDLNESGSFDKVVSVGMYEHVGLAQLPTYFAIAARQLRAGGAMLNHGIVTTDPSGRAQGPAGGEFIDRYVFPGGAVPHLSRVVFEIGNAGLELADIEDLRPHYALTLQHWVRRLEEHPHEAIAASDLRHYRIWRIYLAGMAQAFDRGWLSVAQSLAFKPGPNGPPARPWTRDHVYADAAREQLQPAIADRLDWDSR